MRKLFVPLILPLLMTAAPASHARAEKVLNNFVTELLHAEGKETKGTFPSEFQFENPKSGWVYIGVKANLPEKAQIDSTLDDSPLPLQAMAQEKGSLETMQFLAAGTHKLEIKAPGGAEMQSLVVRAIPEIFFFSVDGLLQQRTNLNSKILRDYQTLKAQGILRNFNVIASDPESDTETYKNDIAEWRNLGRRWVVKTGRPKTTEDRTMFETLWAQPMDNPLTNGIVVDEFSSRAEAMYPAWGEVIKSLGERPKLKGKLFYAFSSINHAEAYAPVMHAMMDSGPGYYLGPEVYFRDLATLKALPRQVQAWRDLYPGSEKHMILFLGPDNLAPVMTFHLRPDENYKAFLEQQFRLLVEDPAFSGLAGIGLWSARYMDDDILNWFTLLTRHYLIEGSRDMLGSDPLEMHHLKNPGFEQGGTGWKLSPAAENTMEVKAASILPYTKRAYSSVPEGERVLYTRRDAKKPNTFSQTVQGLVPGRVYHLNIYAQDLQKPKADEALAVGINLTGVDLIEEKSLDEVQHAPVLKSAPAPTAGGSNKMDFQVEGGDQTVYWNHYRRVFRAKSSTAELEISDWAKGKETPGAEGQEIIWDFIELAPDVSLETPK